MPTELKLYETYAAGDYHSNMKGETKSVKRCLFGKARSPSTSQDQMQSDLESKNNEWNFDFNKEKPIGDNFFVWETISANRAPKFYSRTQTKKNCNPNRSLRRKRRSYTSPGRDEAPKKPKNHMDHHHPVKSTNSRGNENIKQRSKNKKKESDQNQKLISQYFRTKPRHVGKIIDLTMKPELKPKSEPLCDFTNRTYFQTRATASITTRARRRKLSNEA